jgi:hypothetical protein
LGRAAVDTSFTGASSDQETGRVALDAYLGIDAALDVDGISVWMQSRNSTVWSTPPENHVEVDDGGVRGGGRVVVGVPLGEALVLDLSLGADLALLAHTSPFVEDGETIAGEPLGFVRFGVGFGSRR